MSINNGKKSEMDCSQNLKTYKMGRWESKFVLTNPKLVELAKGLQISCPRWKRFVDYLVSPTGFKNVYLNAYRIYHAILISLLIVSHIYNYLLAWPVKTLEFTIPELEAHL